MISDHQFVTTLLNLIYCAEPVESERQEGEARRDIPPVPLSLSEAKSCITDTPSRYSDLPTALLHMARMVITNLFHNLFRKRYALLQDRRNPV